MTLYERHSMQANGFGSMDHARAFPDHAYIPTLNRAVNTSQGCVPTEKRIVHVADLDLEATATDVENVLRSVGQLQGWTYVNAARPTSVLVRYTSREAAMRARTLLDDRKFGKRHLRATLTLDSDMIFLSGAATISDKPRIRPVAAVVSNKQKVARNGRDFARWGPDLCRQNTPVIANGSR